MKHPSYGWEGLGREIRKGRLQIDSAQAYDARVNMHRGIGLLTARRGYQVLPEGYANGGV